VAVRSRIPECLPRTSARNVHSESGECRERGKNRMDAGDRRDDKAGDKPKNIKEIGKCYEIGVVIDGAE